MDLQQLFEEILPGNRLPTQQVTSVTCDSRQVRRGSVFVCIAGSLTDGHNYVVQALQRGEMERCYDTYRDMVQTLQERYGVQ